MMKPPDGVDSWDPPTAEREYFRNNATGNLGFLAFRYGRPVIRLARGSGNDFVEFTESQWSHEKKPSRILPYQAGEVTFEADLKLCQALGFHHLLKRRWIDLKSESKERWIAVGPGPNADPARQDAWKALMGVLKEYL